MERIQLVDVVIAGKHGGSIRLSVPAWICKKLGIRPGDRFAVYLTYDDEAGTEAILYVPVRSGRGSRSDDDSPARREGGRIIIADYVLGQESSSQPSSQGQEGAEGLTAKQKLMTDGGSDWSREAYGEWFIFYAGRAPCCGLTDRQLELLKKVLAKLLRAMPRYARIIIHPNTNYDLRVPEQARLEPYVAAEIHVGSIGFMAEKPERVVAVLVRKELADLFTTYALDGGEPERPSLWISAVIRTVDIEHELREALLLVRLLQEAREKQHVLQEALESLREHLEKATHIVQSLRNMIVQARIEGLEPALACDGGEPEELVIYDYSEHSRAWIEVDRDTRAIHIVQVLPYNPPEKVAVTFLDKELPKLMAALEEARQRLVGPVRPSGGEPQARAERANPSGIGPRGGPGAESSEPGERP